MRKSRRIASQLQGDRSTVGLKGCVSPTIGFFHFWANSFFPRSFSSRDVGHFLRGWCLEYYYESLSAIKSPVLIPYCPFFSSNIFPRRPKCSRWKDSICNRIPSLSTPIHFTNSFLCCSTNGGVFIEQKSHDVIQFGTMR